MEGVDTDLYHLNWNFILHPPLYRMGHIKGKPYFFRLDYELKIQNLQIPGIVIIAIHQVNPE